MAFAKASFRIHCMEGPPRAVVSVAKTECVALVIAFAGKRQLRPLEFKLEKSS
jgi:hypothetical protein